MVGRTLYPFICWSRHCPERREYLSSHWGSNLDWREFGALTFGPLRTLTLITTLEFRRVLLPSLSLIPSLVRSCLDDGDQVFKRVSNKIVDRLWGMLCDSILPRHKCCRSICRHLNAFVGQSVMNRVEFEH